MKTSQASFRQKNPQAIINLLLAYLCTYDPYYPWYQYIANTYNNSITDFHYDETDYFEHLTNLIQDLKVTEILVYYNTDDEFFTFNTLQEEPIRPMVLPSTYSRINTLPQA